MNTVKSRLVALPIHLQCTTCETKYRKGSTFVMYHEILGGTSTLIGVKVHRFYLKCSECFEWLIFRSELSHLRYIAEYGCEEKSHRKSRRRRNIGQNVLQAERLLNVYNDNEETLKTLENFENALRRLRIHDRIEKVTKRWVLRQVITEEFKPDPAKLEDTLYEDYGDNKVSPFILKLSKVRVKDLEDFIDTLHRFFCTKMLQTVIPPGQIALERGVSIYFEHLAWLRSKYEEEEEDNVDGEVSEGPCEFQKAIHGEPVYDFDSDDLETDELTIVPTTLECSTCRYIIPKDSLVRMDHEKFGAELQLVRFQVFRYFLRCPGCAAELVFRTHLSQDSFVVERGIFVKEKDDDDPVIIDAGHVELMPYDKSKYHDPNSVLRYFKCLEPLELTVVQLFEDALLLLNLIREAGKSVDAIFDQRIRQEDRWRLSLPVPPPVRLDWNIPFAKTLLAVPLAHFWRFLKAVHNQLVPMDLLEDELLPERFITKPSERFPTEHTLVPFSVTCRLCDERIFQNTYLDMSKEDIIVGTPEAPLHVYRLYTQCPCCENYITFRSEIYKQRWRLEMGAWPMFDGFEIDPWSRNGHLIDPWALVAGIRNELAPAWADRLEDFYEYLMKHSEDSEYWKLKDAPNPLLELDVADVYNTTRRLMTYEYQRVRNNGLPPAKTAALLRKEALWAELNKVRDMFFLVTDSSKDWYSNFFACERKTFKYLRRPELVQRYKRMSKVPMSCRSSQDSIINVVD